MKIIVIYPGRFQPFGPHHFSAYKKLCEWFGKGNVFIATSNKTDENSPLTFKEKELCISKYQVNMENVIQVQNPYKAEEITSRFNSNETAVIFAYGEKDFGRIQFVKKDGSESYFKEYFGQKNLKPLSECGYVVELPNVSIKVAGQEVNGTYLRRTLPMTNVDQFRQIMGYYDIEIHELFKKKFHPDIITVVESIINEGDTRITRTQLERIEQYVDRLFKEFGIDVNFQDLSKNTHFYQRLNDPRNIEPITTDELRQLFVKASKRYGHKLGNSTPGYEAIFKDMETDINLPFIIKWDEKNKELDLVPKTIMRKKNFTDLKKPFLSIESEIKQITQNQGQYSKHIMHPFEDPNLTDGMMINFVQDLLTNPDNCSVSIKRDGHNFQVTYKDGQILASRNKGTIVNPMSIDQVYQKFEGKSDVQFTFTEAHKAISDQLLSLSHEFLTSVFNNGRTFLNFEICHQRAKNVFDYGKDPFLSLHSLITYDEKGNEISRTKNVPIEFESINEKKNGFFIEITPTVQLPNLSSKVGEWTRQFSSSVNDKKLLFCKLANELIREFCKTQQRLGTNNQTEIIKIITKSRQLCKTPQDKENFKNAYANLTKLGGLESINPIEGFVVEWKGRQYKLTGSFCLLVPIFRIWNNHRYQRN